MLFKFDTDRFIALPNKEENGFYGFYINDLYYWKDLGKIDYNAKYDDAIYEALKEIGCQRKGENYFIYDKVTSVEKLRRVLSPLKWIKVLENREDFFVNDTFPSFTDNKQRNYEILKKFQKNVIIDQVISEYPRESNSKDELNQKRSALTDFEKYVYKNKYPFDSFGIGEEEKCEKWINSQLNKGRIVFAVSQSKHNVHVFSFKDKKEIENIKKDSDDYKALEETLNCSEIG